jgi:U3 small nucleolar RNA-associated protein 6
MSATADKARFFLEKSVPELKEYEKKKIFSKVTNVPGSAHSDAAQKLTQLPYAG